MSQLLRQVKHLIALGQYTDAEELCRHVLSTTGSTGEARKLLAESLYNQGVMLSMTGMFLGAEERYRAALEINPKLSMAWNNLALQAYNSGQVDEALDGYRKAVSCDRTNVLAIQNLVTTLQDTDQLDEAQQWLEKLEKLDPANAGLYMIRKATLVRAIMPDANYAERVRAQMSALLDKCLAAKYKSRSTTPERFAAPYFFLSYHGVSNRELHTKISRAYLHISPALEWRSPHLDKRRDPSKKIRLGIVSANLFNHSIGATSRGLIEHLDQNRFEVIVIRLGPAPSDKVAALIDAAASQVVKVSNTDLAEARMKIASLELDILFYQDIGMEPFSYLLSFARLAPVQCTSFGHPDTTGVPNVDYFISSNLYEPKNAQEHYSEKLFAISDVGTLSYYYRPRLSSDTPSPEEFGLNIGEHIYLCPQTLFKIHTDMDRVFAGILERDPKARIVFIEPTKTHYRLELEARWGKLFDLDRITFIKRMNHEQYMRLLACADVMLDTVHFNGQNTNLEAFSLGIPVVTWPGTMHRGRHTVGMYLRMGKEAFADLIADSADDYAEKAVRVGSDSAIRQSLRLAIATRCSVLYEDLSYVRACEALFMDWMHEHENRSQVP